MVVRLFSNRNVSVVSAVRFIFISSAVCVWMRKKWDLRYIGGKDKRLTKVGKFCVNIIWMNCRNFGMSSAGRCVLLVPRPERKYFIDQIMEHDPRCCIFVSDTTGCYLYATLYNGYHRYDG